MNHLLSKTNGEGGLTEKPRRHGITKLTLTQTDIRRGVCVDKHYMLNYSAIDVMTCHIRATKIGQCVKIFDEHGRFVVRYGTVEKQCA